jgi:probable F420-dependent oxidoreductase
MRFGVHLPVIVDGGARRMSDFVDFAVAAEELGYDWIAANDHVASRSGWLDGPTILAGVCAATTRITLATSVLLPALRHPAVAAKTYATLDDLSGGRVVLGVSAGVLPADFDLIGIPFEERWSRLDESIAVLRALWSEHAPVYRGRHYRLDGVGINPLPERPGGPPLWIGSWGSRAGLRRAARLGDGWIASGFNTSPERFAAARLTLGQELTALGRGTERFGNALASMYVHVTDDPSEAERVARDILAPALGRSPEDLLAAGLLGPPEASAVKLRRYAAAGAERILVWPAVNHVAQIRRFRERVMPLLAAG